MNQQEDRDDFQETTPIGTVYVDGAAVENGEVDLNTAVTHLKGIESTLKYYLGKDNPDLVGRKYSIDARVRSGSLVTDIVGIAFATGVSVGLSSYAKTAGEQLAKNDVGSKTSADLVKNAMSNAKSTIKIAKHFGFMLAGKNFKHNEAEAISAEEIVLKNASGETITVTKEELERYRNTPKNQLRDMMSILTRGTALYFNDKPIGGKDAIPPDAEVVSFKEKKVFDDRDEKYEEKIIFPELTQDMRVTLEGELTRANGRSNTLGISYENRILTCIPTDTATIKELRTMLMDKVRIDAIVERRSTVKDAVGQLKKPKLRIIYAERIEDGEDQTSLFDNQ